MAERDVQETAQPPRFDTWPREKTVPAYTVYEAQRLEASSVRRGLCKFDGRCSPRRSATPGSGGQPDQALSLKPGPEVSNTGTSIYLPRKHLPAGALSLRPAPRSVRRQDRPQRERGAGTIVQLPKSWSRRSARTRVREWSAPHLADGVRHKNLRKALRRVVETGESPD